MIVEKELAENTAHNSEYPTTIRFAQIGSRWSPTSGTREPLCERASQDKEKSI